MHLLAEYVREFGRFQRNARLYLISNALSGVSFGILLVLYNLYLVSLGYGTDFIGLVLFVGTIGAGIAIFPAGVCVDRFGGKIILIWSNLIIAVVGAGQILFRQPLPLLVTGFVAGIVGAFFIVVNAPFLAANSTPDERPHLFSLNIVLLLGTTVVGEVLGGALPVWFRATPWLMSSLPPQLSWLLASQHEPRSYQLALLFAGLIAGPSVIPLFLLEEQTGRPQGSPLHIMRNVGSVVHSFALSWRRKRVPTRGTPTMDVQSHHRGIDASMVGVPLVGTRLYLNKIFTSPIFAVVVVQVLTYMGAGLFIPYFNIYFVRHLGASSALFGVIDGGANGINAVLTLLAPWLAIRIGKVNAIIVTRLVSIPLLLTIGLTNLLPLAAILYLFRQGMMDMCLGVFQVFSMETVPKQHRGLANSSYQASSQVAMALTTPLGGLIIAHIGYPPVFIMGAILYLMAIGTLWVRFGRGGKEDIAITGFDHQNSF